MKGFFVFQVVSVIILITSAKLILARNECSSHPNLEDIAPCKCLEFRTNSNDISCRNLTNHCHLRSVLEDSKYGYNITRVLLRDSKMKYLPSNAFEGYYSWIEISNVTFHERLFNYVPENNRIEDLWLDRVKLPGRWNWQAISPLKKLEALVIKRIPLGGLQNITQVPNTLLYLNLHHCDVKQLQDNEFQDFKKLEMIDIRHDTLRELKRSMFPTPSKIRVMIFRNNHLTMLPSNLFQDMMNLTVIDFSFNQLMVLPATVIYPIRRISYLEGNPINCNCEMKWVLKLGKYVRGNCTAPQDLSGKEITDLTREDFSSC